MSTKRLIASDSHYIILTTLIILSTFACRHTSACGRTREIIVKKPYYLQEQITNRSVEKCQSGKAAEICKGLPYDSIYLPNVLGQGLKQANKGVTRTIRAWRRACDSYLKPFLCSLQLPKCSDENHMILPCRYLCRMARIGCRVMRYKYGFPWPNHVRCELFPKPNSGIQCIGKDETETRAMIRSMKHYKRKSDTTDLQIRVLTTTKMTREEEIYSTQTVTSSSSSSSSSSSLSSSSSPRSSLTATSETGFINKPLHDLANVTTSSENNKISGNKPRTLISNEKDNVKNKNNQEDVNSDDADDKTSDYISKNYIKGKREDLNFKRSENDEYQNSENNLRSENEYQNSENNILITGSNDVEIEPKGRCIIGNYNCRNARVRVFLDGKTYCCLNGGELWFTTSTRKAENIIIETHLQSVSCKCSTLCKKHDAEDDYEGSFYSLQDRMLFDN